MCLSLLTVFSNLLNGMTIEIQVSCTIHQMPRLTRVVKNDL